MNDDELARWWCRFNVWEAPFEIPGGWNHQKMLGAMYLIEELIGQQRCLEMWRNMRLEATMKPRNPVNLPKTARNVPQEGDTP